VLLFFCCFSSSYQPSVFAKAARILRKRDILPARQVSRFEEHLRELSSLSESALALDEILGELPDEYSDGLLGTLMQDPVQLPQSKQFVDRATIQRQVRGRHKHLRSCSPARKGDGSEKAHAHTRLCYCVVCADHLRAQLMNKVHLSLPASVLHACACSFAALSR